MTQVSGTLTVGYIPPVDITGDIEEASDGSLTVSVNYDGPLNADYLTDSLFLTGNVSDGHVYATGPSQGIYSVGFSDDTGLTHPTRLQTPFQQNTSMSGSVDQDGNFYGVINQAVDTAHNSPASINISLSGSGLEPVAYDETAIAAQVVSAASDLAGLLSDFVPSDTHPVASLLRYLKSRDPSALPAEASFLGGTKAIGDFANYITGSIGNLGTSVNSLPNGINKLYDGATVAIAGEIIGAAVPSIVEALGATSLAAVSAPVVGATLLTVGLIYAGVGTIQALGGESRIVYNSYERSHP